MIRATQIRSMLLSVTQRRWSKLTIRMALSYVAVTVSVALVLELLIFLLLMAVVTQGLNLIQPPLTSQIAQKYALLAADQGRGVALDPQATFAPHQPTTLTIPDNTWQQASIPYISTSGDRPEGFVLLITPGRMVLASSYPARYPSHTPVAKLLPERAALISAALRGNSASGLFPQGQSVISYAVEPVWDWRQHPIGAIYVEIPRPASIPSDFWNPALPIFRLSGIVLLIAMIPIGVLFGWLTTHRMVARIQRLATATNSFAAGDYAQQVPIGSDDEIGRLEDHFNRMARQLATTITQRQELASQNARMAERGRIARDLHDSIKQQVFAIGLHLGAALALWERDPAAGAEHVRHADTLAHQTQQELTTLIHEMRPLALQAQGFPTALSALVTTWSQQTGVPVDLHLSGADDLPSEVENALLRVIQEGLANVARHSQARRASLTLKVEEAAVTLTLIDDGHGFSPHLADGAGVGLSSMRERMNALGGSLAIESAPRQGTRIVARCPLDQKGRQ